MQRVEWTHDIPKKNMTPIKQEERTWKQNPKCKCGDVLVYLPREGYLCYNVKCSKYGRLQTKGHQAQ